MKDGEEPNGKLRDLASLLVRRPNLAALVRHLTLHVVRPSRLREASSEDSEDSEYSKEPEEPEELEEHVRPELFTVDQAFKTAANALSLSKEVERNWLRQLSDTHKCHDDLILMLLCSALPKVEKLVLDLKIGPDTHYLEEMIRRAAWRESPFDLQPPFEALTAFVLSHDRFNPRSTGLIASLLKLPAIKEISGCFGETWDDLGELIGVNKNLLELDSSSSPLISLDLAACAVSTADLVHMLRAPKALKTLFYKICPPYYFGFTDLSQALGPQKDCLEILGLDYEDDYEDSYAMEVLPGVRPFQYFGSMISFTSFKSLKVFKTAALFLEIIDNGPECHSLINIFPPSLETLHLTRLQSQSQTILEAVENLLAQKSARQIPSLQKLILEESESFALKPEKLMNVLWRGTQETAIEKLFRVAAAQGVSLYVKEALIVDDVIVAE
ncbi:hypothetical protein MMC22_007681 [Lobaria immixta]|nr:hypothetical protein [Lobaria immixta]